MIDRLIATIFGMLGGVFFILTSKGKFDLMNKFIESIVKTSKRHYTEEHYRSYVLKYWGLVGYIMLILSIIAFCLVLLSKGETYIDLSK